MAMDIAAGNAALKIRYAKGLSKILYDDPKLTPFISNLKRKQGQLVKSAFGSSFVVPIKYNDQQTANASFSKGYTKVAGAFGQSRYVAFTVPPALGYAHAKVTGPAILQSGTDTAAFVDLGAEELDGQLRTLQRKMAVTAFGDGFGSRGRIGSFTTSSVTLLVKEDIVNFEIDQEIVASLTNNANLLRSATALRITARNPTTGVLTLSGDPTPLSWANNDFLFIDGERENSATPARQNWLGVAGWIPITAPTAGDSFAGVDRSPDPRLHGYRFDASTASNTRDALIKAAALGFAHGCKFDVAYMNPFDWAAFASTMEAVGSKSYNVTGLEAKVSFSGIKLMTMMGELPIYPDPTVPKGRCYMLDSSTWYIAYSGDAFVHVGDQGDGLVYRNVAGEYAYGAFARTLSNLVCDAPGENLVVFNIT